MAGKVYVVEGRQFRTESDYALAKKDKETIDRIRLQTDFQDRTQLAALQKALQAGKYRFYTLIGRDFREEVEELLQAAKNPGKKAASKKREAKRKEEKGSRKTAVSSDSAKDAGLEDIVQKELRKRDRRRKLTIVLCGVLGVACLGYFGVYSYYIYRTNNTYRRMSELKEKAAAADSVLPVSQAVVKGPLYTLDEPVEKEVLDEYKSLLMTNRKLIGWVKIEGTYIDYPVMQTTDNEYYLTHNLNQEYDNNGTIFMDKDCDVLKPSTNFILYGHHMYNGRMFGELDRYQEESYYEEHPYISFDTIYEKGLYQVMYVFRSKVYKEAEIVFKYYQFIDANSEQEFDSNMKEMAAMSLYDTGVTAQYGDQLLTLSTCDESETDGRFVVVAKRVETE